MNWFNEPSRWSEDEGSIVAFADAQTDFWRLTDYGFIRDNAHIYGESIATDFDLSVRVKAEYAQQYDQAGAAVRVDESHWIKTGVEMFEGTLRFSAVVTIDHSNWVVADLPQSFNYLNLKLARRRNAIHISYSVDEEELKFVSVAYLEPDVSAFVGVMCAAPQGQGFESRFSDLHLARC
jgi:regulation of enolase protein 1 (concanavalin A-like superfamily)